MSGKGYRVVLNVDAHPCVNEVRDAAGRVIAAFPWEPPRGTAEEQLRQFMTPTEADLLCAYLNRGGADERAALELLVAQAPEQGAVGKAH